jgi:hypothetical protein
MTILEQHYFESVPYYAKNIEQELNMTFRPFEIKTLTFFRGERK